MKNFEKAKILFQKYLDRTATDAELEEMFEILKDRRHFEIMYDLFEKEWESRDVELKPDHLTLEKIRTDFRTKQLQSTDRPVQGWDIWVRWTVGMAAAMLVLLAVFVWNSGEGEQVIYQTTYGETKELILDDQTIVKLNANSTLVWHADWQKTGVRKVELTGEAFFKVQTIQNDETLDGEKLPYQVVTSDLTVNVHGTTFNVEARRQRTNVFLQSGEVELELNPGNSQEDETEMVSTDMEVLGFTRRIMMKPGDAVSYSLSQQKLEQTDNGTTEMNASWIEGSLLFENDRLEDVLQQLEDIYGKQFEVVDTALLERKVNLGLPFEDWSTVSGLMTLSLEIDMKDMGDKIILKRLSDE